MEATVTLKKTDVKLYEVRVSFTMDDVKSWVDKTFGSYEQEWEFLQTLAKITGNKKKTKEQYYQDYLEHYLQDYVNEQDAQVLFANQCDENQKFLIESENCTLRSIQLDGKNWSVSQSPGAIVKWRKYYDARTD